MTERKDGNTAQHLAAQEGDVERIRQLLANYCSTKTRNKLERTALHEAAASGKLEALKLLWPESDPEAADASCNTALHLAIQHGHVYIVEYILSIESNVLQRDIYGNNILHMAAKKNAVDILKLFLTSKHSRKTAENISYTKFLSEQKNYSGLSPIHVATENHSCDFLLELCRIKDINVDDQNQYKRTALHLAVEKNHKKLASVLLEFEANIDAKDCYEKSPIHLAADTCILRMLLKHGADPLCKDDYGLLPIHVAAMNNYINILTYFLEIPQDDCTLGWYKALQKSAAIEGETDVGKFLLKQMDKHFNTSLHLAAKNNNVHAVKLLLEHGAELLPRNNYGLTPMHMAACDNAVDVLEFLLTAQNNDKILNLEAFQKIKLLAEKKGETCIGKFLLQQEANFLATPLHWAVRNDDNLDAVKLLLKHGADLLARDKHGRTSVHFAAMYDAGNVLQYFLNGELEERDNRYIPKSLLHQRDQFGECPLHLATKNKHIRIIELLLHHDADISLENHKGITPLAIARNNRSDIVNLFNAHLFKKKT